MLVITLTPSHISSFPLSQTGSWNTSLFFAFPERYSEYLGSEPTPSFFPSLVSFLLVVYSLWRSTYWVVKHHVRETNWSCCWLWRLSSVYITKDWALFVRRTFLYYQKSAWEHTLARLAQQMQERLTTVWKGVPLILQLTRQQSACCGTLSLDNKLLIAFWWESLLLLLTTQSCPWVRSTGLYWASVAIKTWQFVSRGSPSSLELKRLFCSGDYKESDTRQRVVNAKVFYLILVAKQAKTHAVPS